MSDVQLIKQNRLLKEYIKTLENENESRNKERVVLCDQIDRLIQQNKQIRQNKKENSNNDKLLKAHKQLKKQMDEAKIHINSLQNQLNNRDQRIKKLNQQRKYNSNIKNNQNQIEIIQLQTIIKNWQKKYQSKIIQLQTISSEYQIFKSQKFSTSQTETKITQKLESQLFLSQEKISILESQRNKIFQQNKSLELTNSELKNEIQIIQRQKVISINQVRNMQTELYNLNQTIMNLRQNQAQYHNSLSKINYQEKQIQTLTVTMNTLRNQLENIQKILREKQIIINDLKMKLNNQNQISSVQNNEINAIRFQYTTQINILRTQLENEKKITEKYQKLQKQFQNLQFQYNNLSKLYEEIQNKNQITNTRNIKDNNGNEQKLLKLFQQLKQELTEVKQANLRISNENNKLQQIMFQRLPQKDNIRYKLPKLEYNYQHHQELDSMNQNKLYNFHQNVVPVSDQSKVSHQKSYDYYNSHDDNYISEKNISVNNSKWQNLQRRINALRDQNDELRKNLFD